MTVTTEDDLTAAVDSPPAPVATEAPVPNWSKRTCWSRTCPSTACAASTSPPMPAHPARGATAPFDGSRAWTLHPQVALRPESFGALAYHFGTRRLSFLKSRTLLAVVSRWPGNRPATMPAGPPG